MKCQVLSISGLTDSETIEKLVKEVDDAMTIGWEPPGGVEVIGNHYAQTMTKRR